MFELVDDVNAHGDRGAVRGSRGIFGQAIELLQRAPEQVGVTGIFKDPVIYDGNLGFTAVTTGNDVVPNVSTAAVLEPDSLAILGLGMLGMETFAVQSSRAARRK